MNNEMMLFQARQDFIDLHQDLFAGKRIRLEKYEQITSDLKAMDDLNFELILQFVEDVEKFPISDMWQKISAYVEQVKETGLWSAKKEEYIVWADQQLVIEQAGRE